jgi:hypothetical protein
MQTYHLPADRAVFGRPVTTFPEGIGEAFEALVKKIPGGFNRSFYGISYMASGHMVYIAAAEEREPGEAEKYDCERYTIEKGDYLAIPVMDWRSKTDSIKDVFHELMQDSRVNASKPAVEWYKNDDEMWCMIRMA